MATIFSKIKRELKAPKPTQAPNIILPSGLAENLPEGYKGKGYTGRPISPGELQRAQKAYALRRKGIQEWQKGTGPRFDKAVNLRNNAMKEARDRGELTREKREAINKDAKGIYESEGQRALRNLEFFPGTRKKRTRKKTSGGRESALSDILDRGVRDYMDKTKEERRASAFRRLGRRFRRR